MTEQPNDDAALAALFDAARGRVAPLPDDLFARIMADAVAADTARAAAATAPRRTGWLAPLGGLPGGWPSWAGLATAAVAGVWIGVAQPAMLDGFGLVPGAVAAFDLDDLMPGFDALASEG